MQPESPCALADRLTSPLQFYCGVCPRPVQLPPPFGTRALLSPSWSDRLNFLCDSEQAGRVRSSLLEPPGDCGEEQLSHADPAHDAARAGRPLVGRRSASYRSGQISQGSKPRSFAIAASAFGHGTLSASEQAFRLRPTDSERSVSVIPAMRIAALICSGWRGGSGLLALSEGLVVLIKEGVAHRVPHVKF